MMRMKINLDEQKVKENGEYTVDEIYEKIDALAKKADIIKKEGKNMYIGNDNRYDFANFGRIIIALAKYNWFKNSVSEWLWYDGEEIDDIIDFCDIRRDVV